MVKTNADKVPADSKVIIIGHFISFEGFAVSRETAIQITKETMATMAITSLDILNTPLIYISLKLLHVLFS